MFGIESLREEIALLKDSVDELKDKIQAQMEEEVTFSEMTHRVDKILNEFKEEFFLRYEDHFKMEIVTQKLLEIIKRLPEPVKEIKIKDKKK